MTKKLLAAFLLSTALVSAGCGDDHPEEEGVDAEACEHLQEGPATAVISNMGTNNPPPEIRADHRRYDITLMSGSEGNQGMVAFAASEAADYVIYTNADVPLSVTTSSGEAVEIEESTSSSKGCTDIKGRHVVPLTVGTHYLTFGPTSVATFGVLIEESHGDHGHEH
ncbi:MULTISPECIES: hypothetical protein [Myxococcus]|nr:MULTISPECIES: hypothetical protein [Myxococcus]NOJ55172.1 hypothetical protein [Myxococcus xanthus]QPM82418.1 hypothetical protein I5Q59_14575 [Myxococcus xanthus]QVW64723.1 hypothetical protein JTM82_19920 [Myxococcus xanthus DZ2]QZZ50661.1 hypothetical protein MyxoNM_15740 [Myxococcus xanthus]UEO02205.1 hypothetical protein K1515_22875 [Myxococcus xanthus DZ2]